MLDTARIAGLVRDHYVFPEIGARIAELISAKRYDAADDADLAERVTSDLQSVNGDKHLRLKHHVEALPDLQDEQAFLTHAAIRARRHMGGVHRIEHLDGNVGLLALAPELFPVSIVGSTVSAAMSLLADCAAVVLDLRELHGGDPATVALVCSHLFERSTHLNDMVPRDPAQTTQSWTSGWVSGKRVPASTPVYVLTSARTFSGGEELAYDLQALGRATVIGETTGGGANAREGFAISDHLELTVPVVAARNAVTRKNWEGIGVAPDITVAAADALSTAHELALRSSSG